jgi:DNA polymerase-3 subunit gamma/tau
VYLIDEVHMLSTHSFNALLKTLEEPPPHVKFLLATTDPQKLPATVLSRCLQFNLKNMPPEQIVGHLGKVLEQEMVSFEEPALWLLGRAAAGSMRDALSLTDQAIAFGSGKVGEDDVRSMLGSVDLSFIYQLLEALCEGEPGKLLDVVAHMGEHAPDFEGGLDELLSLIHRVAMAQVVPDAIDNSWGDAERVGQIASAITAEDAQLFYQIALNGKRDIGLAPDPRGGFEMILLRMLAFRPAAVIDDSLGPEDLQPVAQPNQSSAAVEVGTQVKKPHKAPQPAVAPLEPIPVESPAIEPKLVEPKLVEPKPVEPKPVEPIPVVPRPVEQTPAMPAGTVALADLNPALWPQLLESLGLVGIVYNIASHCDLCSNDNGKLEFVLDAGNASLFNDGHNDKIRLALENYFGHSLSVSIVPGDVQRETPAMRKARLAQERQQEAIVSIEADPQLQELIARFDGELDRSSIVPTDI